MRAAETRRHAGAVPCIVLAASDNVGMPCADVAAGDTVRIPGGKALIAQDDVRLGHKIALVPIADGDRVVKCGVPIGTATRTIAAGAHVHIHNLRSDYLPTFTLEDGRRRKDAER